MQSYVLILLGILVVLLIGIIYFGWRKLITLEIENSRNKYDIEALRGLLSKILSDGGDEVSEQIQQAAALEAMQRQQTQQFQQPPQQYQQTAGNETIAREYNLPKEQTETDVQTLESTNDEVPELESTVTIESIESTNNEEEEETETENSDVEETQEDLEDAEKEEEAEEVEAEDDEDDEEAEEAEEDDEENEDEEAMRLMEEELADEETKETDILSKEGEEEREDEEAMQLIEDELEKVEESDVVVPDDQKEGGDEPEVDEKANDLDAYNRRLEEMLAKQSGTKRRRQPSETAKNYKVGFRKESSHDGNMYEVVMQGRSKKWALVSEHLEK